MPVERPQQVVATNAAAAALVGNGCVAKVAAPSTNDMLTTPLTIDKGTRVLLLSMCFEDATTVIVRKAAAGVDVASSVSMTLNEGSQFGAGHLFSHFVVPVEEGDRINFRLGTANDNAKTRMFKVEVAAGR